MCSCLLNCAWWPKTGQELCICRVGRGWSWRCALSHPYHLAQTTPCKTSASPCQKCFQLYHQVDWGLIILQCVPTTPKIQDWYRGWLIHRKLSQISRGSSQSWLWLCNPSHGSERRSLSGSLALSCGAVGARDDAHTRSKRHPGHWSSFGDQIWFIVEISFSQNIVTVPTAISHYYHHCQCHHQGERRNAVVALEWCVLCQEEEGGDLIARQG